MYDARGIQETVPSTAIPSGTSENEYPGCDGDVNLPGETPSAFPKVFFAFAYGTSSFTGF